MNKSYYSLGLMSGTSIDGVDASIIQSDGKAQYKTILDKYFEYPKDIYEDLTKLKDKIKSAKDLKRFEKQTKSIEKKITLFHGKAINKILKKSKVNVDFIGFHGQTIFHNGKKKISKQLGDGNLLSKLTKKTVVYNFRQNDLKNGGEGAPLTPIFHKLLVDQNKIDLPVIILNIGGIANITCIDHKKTISSYDVGPGNCLIDEWIRLNSKNKNKYDKNGKIAQSGKTNSKILKKAIKKFNKLEDQKQLSFDVRDFDLSFARSLSLKNGAATLTDFTSQLLAQAINSELDLIFGNGRWGKEKIFGGCRILICGGGRKNKTLMKLIKKNIHKPFFMVIDKFELIDIYNIDGDFVESQAFAYLAIRSFLKLPISFPKTTGCKVPCTGGVIVKNF